jgi:integrase
MMASPAPDASQLKDGILFKDVTKRTLLALEQLLAESLKPTSTYENYILVPKAEYQKLVALSDKSVKKMPWKGNCQSTQILYKRTTRRNPIGLSKRGGTLKYHSVCKNVCSIGERANIVVGSDGGKTKYASAHDLRRSFGLRWSERVMPAQLKELMRHESISTTMSYYVGRNAETTAAALYDAVGRRPESRSKSDTLGDTAIIRDLDERKNPT